MRRRLSRSTTTGLMGLVLVSAVIIAALRDPSEFWASAVYTLTLGACGIAILGTAFRTGASRTFWAGFALFGAGTLLLSFRPWPAAMLTPPPLLSAQLSTSLASASGRDRQAVDAVHAAFLDLPDVLRLNAERERVRDQLSRTRRVTLSSRDPIISHLSRNLKNLDQRYQALWEQEGPALLRRFGGMSNSAPGGGSHETEDCTRVLISLAALATAYLGALLTRTLFGRRQPEGDEAS